MAFTHGKNQKALLDGYDLSSYLTGYDFGGSVDLPVTTTLGSAAVRRTVVGLPDGTLSLQGLHDTTTGATHPVFKAAYGAASASVITCLPAASGSAAMLAPAREASFKTGSAV